MLFFFLGVGLVGSADSVHLHGNGASRPQRRRRRKSRSCRRRTGLRRGLCHRLARFHRRHPEHQAARRSHLLLSECLRLGWVLSRAVSSINLSNIENKPLGMPRIKPGTGGWEALTVTQWRLLSPGYCLLPLSISLSICRLVLLAANPTTTFFILRSLATLAGLLWASYAAMQFLGDCQPPR